MKIVVITLFMLLASSLNATTVHKWTDENGVVHFSNKKDIPAKAEKIRVKHSKGRTYRNKTKPFRPYVSKKKKAKKKRKSGTKVSKLCKKWSAEIDNIDTRLRSRYSTRYGIKMEEKRKKIKAKKVKWCRNPKFQNQYINIR